MPQIGEKDYRDGAWERIDESLRLLHQGDTLSGCVYLAGRAVEGMLRALIWKSDTNYRFGKRFLETGHDLRRLLEEVRGLVLLSDRDNEMLGQVQVLAGQWSNDMRFVPERWIESYWRKSGVVSGRNTMKHASKVFVDACLLMIQRCEKLYGKINKK